MAKPFEALRRKMPPMRQARARARTDAMLTELVLAGLRRSCGVTQEQLAEALNIRQAAISKMERRDDVLLSTLAAYVRALGGELEVLARFGDRVLTLGPPAPASAVKRGTARRRSRAG